MIILLALPAVALLAYGIIGLTRAHWPNDRITPTQLRELRSLPVTAIANARDGRIKLAGIARGARTEMSLVGTTPCFALRRVVMRRTVQGTTSGITTEHFTWAYPFELDDGTGKATIDAANARLDLEPFQTPEAMVMGQTSTMGEEGLRDGDTVVVVGDVRVSRGAYRAGAANIHFVTPPVVSWRSIPETIPAIPMLKEYIVASGMLVVGLAATLYTLLSGDAMTRVVMLGVAVGIATLETVLRWRARRMRASIHQLP